MKPADLAFRSRLSGAGLTLTLVAAMALLSVGLLGQECSDYYNPGYIRFDDASAGWGTDECITTPQATCYDCVAQDRQHGGWVHCAENESGSMSICNWYGTWAEVSHLRNPVDP